VAVAENYVASPDIARPPDNPAGDLKPSVAVKLVYSFGQSIESGYLVVSGFIFL
jgi:hypothetical protein